MHVDVDDQIEDLLRANRTYAEIANETGTSRGKVWRVAMERKIRKFENRIAARRADREAQMRSNIEAAMNRTSRADALEFLSGFPDSSISAIVTSPPYNCGKAYSEDPTGDAMLPLRYFGWLCSIVAEMERVIKPGGTIAMVVGGTYDRNGTLVPIDWLLADAFGRTGLTYQNRIAWIVSHGLTPRRRLSNRYETIVIYSKGEPTFNPSAARTPTIQFDKRAFRGPDRGRASSHPHGSAPSDVWTIKHLGHNHGEKTAHPAQYPIAIAKRLVLLYTQPGDIVCDPFSGSGSTHVAAIEAHRPFVGCDAGDYADIRDPRVAAARPDTFFPFPGVTQESLAFWAREIPAWRGSRTAVTSVPHAAPSRSEDEQLVMDFVERDLAADPRRRVRAAAATPCTEFVA